MTKRLAATATLLVVVAAAAGLFASASDSASSGCSRPPSWPSGCLISLTATGPSPSRLEMPAETVLFFANPDSVSHTVVFANGGCSFTLAPGEGFAKYVDRVSPDWGCPDQPSLYVGSYAYTVDGKFPGTVAVTPQLRVVTLTARRHTIPGGARLSLHGRVVLNHPGRSPAAPVIVLARRSGKQPFRPIATVRTRYPRTVTNDAYATYGWKLDVQPKAATTFIAEVKAQRLCYFPVWRCAYPQGQTWADARSKPFSVRLRKQGWR